MYIRLRPRIYMSPPSHIYVSALTYICLRLYIYMSARVSLVRLFPILPSTRNYYFHARPSSTSTRDQLYFRARKGLDPILQKVHSKTLRTLRNTPKYSEVRRNVCLLSEDVIWRGSFGVFRSVRSVFASTFCNFSSHRLTTICRFPLYPSRPAFFRSCELVQHDHA